MLCRHNCLCSWILCIVLLSCCPLQIVESVTVTVNSLQDAWPIDTASCMEAAAASNTCTLRNAISFCAQSDGYPNKKCAIELPNAKALNWNATSGPVVINTVPEELDMMIRGNNAVVTMDTNNMHISAFLKLIVSDSSRVSCEVRNITFSNFTDGALHFDSANKVKIEHSTFSNNRGVEGGAVYVHETEDIKIDYSAFSSNRGVEGGAVYIDETENMKLSNCMFSENTASSIGGALCLNSDVHQLSITETQFHFNKANKGGAITAMSRNVGTRIEYCTFIKNSARSDGGALDIEATNTFWALSSSTFADNQAMDGSGGALLILADQMTISDSVFLNNSATADGGVLSGTRIDRITVSNVTFVNNSAKFGGAVHMTTGVQRFSLSDSTFIGNRAQGSDGGSIGFNSNNNDISLIRCHFERNEAADRGGAVHIGLFNTLIRVNNATFIANRAESGGAMYIDAFSSVTVDDAKFMANSVCTLDGVCGVGGPSIGGAIFYFGVLRDENTLSIRRSHFEKNMASDSSALRAYGNGVTLEGCSFIENAATSDAVVVIDVGGNIDISDCMFSSHSGSILSISSSRTIFLKSLNISGTNSTHSAVRMFMNSDVSIDDCYFSGNIASSGGALFLDSCDDVNIMGSEIIGNSVRSSGGGVYIEDSHNVVVNGTNFVGNIVYAGSSEDEYNSGGGLFILSSTHVVLANVVFASNIAGDGYTGSSNGPAVYNSGGALFARSTTDILVTGSVFTNNSAGSAVGMLFNSGGGVFLESCDAILIEKSMFLNNSAGFSSGGDYNSGGGVFVTSTATIDLNDNTFQACRAEYGGGGGVFHEASTGVTLREMRNVYLNNSALYGNDIATDALSLVFDNRPPPYDVSLDSFMTESSFRVELVDLYGNTVANHDASISAATSPSQCGSETPYIAGQTTARLVAGAGVLTFMASCYPNSVLNIEITAFEPSHVDSISLHLQFRGCHVGEYYSAGSCWECENGTFSLQDNSDLSVTSCQICPAHATCYGSVIRVDEGFWRQSNHSSNLLDCPVEEGCVGGIQTGNELCDVGYTGALCGVCEAGYYHDFLTDSCSECTENSINITAIITIVLCAIMVVVMFVWMCGKRVTRFIGKQMGVAWFYSTFGRQKSFNLETRKEKILKSEANSLKIQSKIKQLVTFYQIVSSFPSVLSMSMPPVYYHITYMFSFFNVSVFVKDLGLTCSYEHLDYVTLVIMSTLGPIIFCIGLAIVQYCHVYFTFNLYSEAFRNIANTKNRIIVLKSTYFHIFLGFTYLILPGVTTILFGMLKPCVDVDPQDSVAGVDLYLEADYSLKCDTPRYTLGVIWATVFTFVYPVGIPCLYFFLLYKERKSIKKRANTDVSMLDEKGLQNLEVAAIRMSSLSFLSQEYHPEYWYFEVVETYRKLFLTSVLSVINPGSTSQLVVAELFCAFCLIVYIVLRPFRDAEMTRTSLICQVQIWYIVFVLILLNEDVSMPYHFYIFSIVAALLIVALYMLCWAIIEFCPLPTRLRFFLQMFSLPVTSSNEKKYNTSRDKTTEEYVDRAIEVLCHAEPVVDELRIHEADSNTLKIGKMRSYIIRLEKKRKVTQRHMKKLDKLRMALSDREQNITDDIHDVQAQVELLKEHDHGETDIFSVELTRHDLRYANDYDVNHSSDDNDGDSDSDSNSHSDSDVEGNDDDRSLSRSLSRNNSSNSGISSRTMSNRTIGSRSSSGLPSDSKEGGDDLLVAEVVNEGSSAL